MEGRNMVDVQRSNFKPRDEKVQMHYVNNPAAAKDTSLQLRPKLQDPGSVKLNDTQPHHH